MCCLLLAAAFACNVNVLLYLHEQLQQQFTSVLHEAPVSFIRDACVSALACELAAVAAFAGA
jgi:hypothetical protein